MKREAFTSASPECVSIHLNGFLAHARLPNYQNQLPNYQNR